MQDDLWKRAAPALSHFKREGLPVEVLDELHWRIMPVIALVQPLALDRGYLFWRATGYWSRPSHGGGGAGKLIEEMRRASSSQGRVRCDALAPQHYKVVTFFLATMPDPIGRPPVAMARRSAPTTRKRIGATSAARTPTERSSIVHSSLYLLRITPQDRLR
jgi:hypothetical protein